MSAETQARLHLCLTGAWLVAAVPICLFLSSSIPFLVFVSVYANVAGHWSGYQAARGEVNSPDA